MKVSSSFLLIFLVILFASWSICLEEQSSRTLLQVSGQSERVSGDRRFCALDENNECDFPEYLRQIAVFGVAGVVMAGLSLISLIAFLLGRFICNTFGGRKRSKGICCPDADSFEGYSKASIWVLRIILIIVGVGMVLTLSFGFSGNQQVNDGLDSMISAVFSGIGVIEFRVERLEEKLQSVEVFNETEADLNSVKDSLSSIRDQGSNVRSEIDQANGYRSAAIFLSFLIPVALFCVAALGALLCRWTKLLFIVGLGLFIASFFIWFSFGIHISMAIVSSDLCAEIDDFLDSQRTRNQTNAALDTLLKCVDGEPLADMNDIISDAENEVANRTCSAAQDFCNSTDFQIFCPTEPCTAENYVEFTGNMTIRELDCTGAINPPVDCTFINHTLRQCEVNCKDESLQGNVTDIVNTLDLALEYIDIIRNDILPLLDCGFIGEAFEQIREGFCDEVTGGWDAIASASAILGLLLIPATFALIMGYKRFQEWLGRPKKKRESSRNTNRSTDLELNTTEQWEI